MDPITGLIVLALLIWAAGGHKEQNMPPNGPNPISGRDGRGEDEDA